EAWCVEDLARDVGAEDGCTLRRRVDGGDPVRWATSPTEQSPNEPRYVGSTGRRRDRPRYLPVIAGPLGSEPLLGVRALAWGQSPCLGSEPLPRALAPLNPLEP